MSETARDRFVLQPNVLKGLDWNLMRVWVLDWLDDSEKVMSIIKTEIEKNMSTYKSKPKTYNVIKPEPKTDFAGFTFEREDNAIAIQTTKTDYSTAKITTQGTPEDFYSTSSILKIRKAAEMILEKESPISKKLWFKKVTALWGISRGGSKVDSIFETAVSRIRKNKRTEGDRIFYWKEGQYHDICEGYRVVDSNGNKRNMDDIPPQEVLCAIKEVLNEQISLSESDLVKDTAKKFGFSRTGSVIESAVKYAVAMGIKLNKIEKISNGNIVLKE